MVSIAHILAKLPPPIRRILTDAAREARSPLQRFILRAAGMRAHPIPDPPPLPVGALSVYIAPANYAAQGNAWARALERDGTVEAWNTEVRQPGGFDFAADRIVGLGPFHLSRTWQEREFEAVAQRSHVLIESARPLFGRLFDYDVVAEVRALQSRGVRVAMMAHGSEMRSPEGQRKLTPWSPFHDNVSDSARLDQVAERTKRIFDEANVQVFVATPDLLIDAPSARWVPNVVDTSEWQTLGREVGARDVPTVVHVPTNAWIKGTPLIAPALATLASQSVIAYSPLSALPREEMRAVIGDADIVIDQVRLGMYGTTAVEAMAAGRVVVGHVAESIRKQIRVDTGLDVPIVEATADTIGDVLSSLAPDVARMTDLGEAGRSYVSAVHDGTLSARILRDCWITPTAD